MFKDLDIQEIIEKVTQGNALLKSVLTTDVISQISDEKLEEINKAISETDPKKIKLAAEEIIKKYN
jgi:hypothetical protein|tara:strand:+ start:1469 stop:1666 length:198 start_codon:yes stop_codon:yes gene_type:complete